MGASDEDVHIYESRHTDKDGNARPDDYCFRVHNAQDNVDVFVHGVPRSDYEDAVDEALNGEQDLYDWFDNKTGPVGDWWDDVPTSDDYRSGVWEAFKKKPWGPFPVRGR